jgi:peptidoglycan/xylan/chitin deacetylase (PgdA/CDA1 family)
MENRHSMLKAHVGWIFLTASIAVAMLGGVAIPARANLTTREPGINALATIRDDPVEIFSGPAWVSAGNGNADYCRRVGAGPNNVNSYVACTPYNGTSFGGTVVSGLVDWGYDTAATWVSAGNGTVDYCRRVGAGPNNVNSYVACTPYNGTSFGPTAVSGLVDWGYDTAATWVSAGNGTVDYCRRVGAGPNNVNSYVACTPYNGTSFGPTAVSGVVDWGYLPPISWVVPGTAIYNLDTAAGSPYVPGQKVAALTFDDGPSIYTPQILQILTTYGVPGTFQIIGENGAAHPGTLQEEVADGMTLVNHTWTHVDLTTLPPSEWAGQVDQTDALLEGFTGQPVRCLRPPYGYTNASVVAQLGQRGLAELMWDVDPSDYLMPGSTVIARRVLSALHPGAIVVLHDGGGNRSQTVAALPTIITGILAAGYTLVPVCEN